MRNANTHSVGSSSRSMKFSTRHACVSHSVPTEGAVMMVMLANALCNRMQKRRREK
jgi:hypothetical protein